MNVNHFPGGNAAREPLELYGMSQVSENSAPHPDAAGASATDRSRIDNLCKLFPNLPENAVKGIAETLHGYCAIVWRIYERLKQERPELIDELMRSRKMKGKVDSSD